MDRIHTIIKPLTLFFLLLWGSQTLAEDLQLNGVAVHNERRKDYFIAGLYMTFTSKDSKAILRHPGPKRMELRITLDRFSPRKFSNLWRDSIVINNSPDDVVKYGQDMLSFSNLMKGNLVTGDQVTIDFIPNNATIVRVNGQELGRFSPNFFELLLNSWIGPRPTDSDFKRNLLKEGKMDDALLGRYNSIEPLDGRNQIVAVWEAGADPAAAAEAARQREIARAEAEASAKAAEAEARAREEARRKAEAEAKAREEARLIAEAEAKQRAEEEARRKAEEEAQRIAKQKAEEEAKQRAAAEAKAKAEAEAAAKAAEKARLAASAAETDAKAKAEAEAAAKNAEEARLRAEAEAKAKAEAEARALAAAKAEEEARKRAEEEARKRAEAEAKAKQEEEARALAEAKAKQEEEARQLAEAEAAAQVEAKAKADAEALAASEGATEDGEEDDEEDGESVEPMDEAQMARELYKSQLVAHFYEYLEYPEQDRRRRKEGTLKAKIVINREGNVESSELVEQARYGTLNFAANKAIQRAQPYPPMAEEIEGETFEFEVPILFRAY